jgi:hypothetical protein
LGEWEWELSFDSFASHNTANHKHFPGARAAASDYGTAENLDPFLVPFLNFRVHIDRVADAELVHVRLEVGTFNSLQDLLAHDSTKKRGMAGPTSGPLGKFLQLSDMLTDRAVFAKAKIGNSTLPTRMPQNPGRSSGSTG